jgi:hypothetical protein
MSNSRRLTYQSKLYPTAETRDLKAVMESAAKERKTVADKLTDAILLQFATPRPMDAGKRISKPWSVFDEKQYLVVLLRKNEWEAFRNTKSQQLTIRAVVHKKDDPNATMNGQRVYQFDLDEFSSDSHVIAGPRPGDGDLVWAVHNMNDSSLLSTEILNRIKNVKRILAEWDEEVKKQ